ncbi:Protein argonaute [Lecanora helva]
MSSGPVSQETKLGFSTGGLDSRPKQPFVTDIFYPNEFRDQMPTELEKRNGRFGTKGKKAIIEVNSHEVKSWPTDTIYQYDIVIGSGVEKRGLINAIWKSEAVQEKIGQGFIFDGNKLGWSPRDFGQGLRLEVDLDKERGREKKDDRPNIHRIRISKARNDKIHLAVVREYLHGRCDFNNGILEAISFLDHLLRETPSKKLINLRRSYFSRIGESQDRVLLGGGVEAMKGIYQSIRMAEGKRLVINADVSNSCFWHQTTIAQNAMDLCGYSQFPTFMAAVTPRDGQLPPQAGTLNRLKKMKFIVKHRAQNPGADKKMWTVIKISNKNAKQHYFDVKDRQTKTEYKTNVFDYYIKKYNIRLDKWQLPLLETQKKDILFPMELAVTADAQRYPFKLNEQQTANMIKFAVSRPPVRRAAITAGSKLLDWANDPMLRGYKMAIDQNFLKTQARILEPPEVQFAKGTTKPAYSGRWDLRGQIFFKPNAAPLTSWGICVISAGNRAPINPDQLTLFKNQFIQLYQRHGGSVAEKNPIVVAGVPDAANTLKQCFESAGNKAKARPQMLLVILPNKSADVYQRVKRNCDIRFGVMSQCVQSSHVVKNAPQYCSNVAMKFNCKLGGTTSALKTRTKFFDVPTMIIGADVSHPAPGLEQASMAAMTVSLDPLCCRYGAAVETNGKRVEMITGTNISKMLTPLIDWWMKNVGQGQLPKHVYYFRDGVSEGQYIPLLNMEVADIKKTFDELGLHVKERRPKFTVVVAEKRHHHRFFPQTGSQNADKNGNPLPGTVVDRDITTPFENDIFLCSHVAIQGTARPTHYTTIMDEAKVDTDKFQAMLYEHCYQYQRATTPVSLFPAVYYAHLASKRGESHIDMDATKRAALQAERRAHPGQESSSRSEETRSQTEWPPLMKWPKDHSQIHLGMWYI